MTVTYEGMEQDTATGEAIVNGIPTGWFFEQPTQLLPVPESPETGRHTLSVMPWAFATVATAQRVREAMQLHTQMPLEVFSGDQNQHFPLSVRQRYIGVQSQPRTVSVNAGLVASYIARTTARLGDGKGGTRVVQNDRLVLANAIESLARAVE